MLFREIIAPFFLNNYTKRVNTLCERNGYLMLQAVVQVGGSFPVYEMARPFLCVFC